MSERHACRLMGLGRTTHRYRARKAERDSELRARLKKLAAKRLRFGYRRLTAMLVREGMPTNHKRVYRLYREEGLAMRIRQRRRIRWRGAGTSSAATRRDECLNANWFTSLSDARRKIEAWRQDYNQQRPHSSLDYVPPAEFARTRAEMRA